MRPKTYDAYKKYVDDHGIPFALKKEKVGQVISKVYGKILIKVCVINGVNKFLSRLQTHLRIRKRADQSCSICACSFHVIN